jgi:TolB protein
MKIFSRFSNRIVYPVLVVLILVNLSVLVYLGRPIWQSGGKIQPRVTNTVSFTETAVGTPTLPVTIGSVPNIISTLPPDVAPQEGLKRQGVIILAMHDGNYIHLFAYHPQFLPLTRLTNGTWDDIDPALSPDGTRLAYSSHKNGYWNIYILDLARNQETRLTDTPTYDGSPTWSPDGQWIAYESYKDNNLEIMVQSVVDDTQAPLQLTDDSGADHSPAWAPQGRSIAFVSDRSGNEEIWLAHLDQVDNRFENISNSPQTQESYPSWSPDGRYLAWSANDHGDHTVVFWDSRYPEASVRPIGSGDRPVWNPSEDAILTEIRGPNKTALAIYSVTNGELVYPMFQLPHDLKGLAWKADLFPEALSAFKLPGNARDPLPRLWEPRLTTNPMPPAGRFGVIKLDDVAAPYPYLHDAVDEAFRALRQETAQEVGWDVLGNLENAYLPLTDPPTPSVEQNWLYTGRAFALNPLPMSAGWMVVVKEDFEGQVYWRVYIKARFQDGSTGAPLTEQPWDLNSRYAGSPQWYEEGGHYAAVPAGYWVDMTELAARYDWQRLPALVNWRVFFPGTRFNQFVMQDGRDWHTAMSELYPPEALVTPTRVPTYTPTVTITPTYYHFPTGTPTPTPTSTATLNPTWTISP